MHKNIYFISFILFMSLLLVACSQIQKPETPAVFLDKDLNQALEQNTYTLPGNIDISETTLDTQAVLPGAQGFIFYSYSNPTLTNPWALYSHNQASNARLRVYQGKREIQSVAGSEDGNTIIASMRQKNELNSTTDFEIWLLKLSPASVTLLTSNGIQDTDVSISANGRTISWQEQTTSGVIRTVVRKYLVGVGGTLESEIRIQAAKQPTISGDGSKLAYIKTSGANQQVILRNLVDNTETIVSSTTATINAPSTSNDGKKVAWLEQAGTSYTIKLKNFLSETVYPLTTDTVGLAHPFITADGKWLSYSRLINGSWQVRTRNLGTVQDTPLTSLATNVSSQQGSWQTLAPQTCSQNQSNQPNFILILTDDQTLEDLQHMPLTLNQLGDKGITFNNSFVPIANCCPSRVSILRGQYPHNHQIYTNGPPDGGFPKFHQTGLENSTLATWLNDAGYRTALAGKYLNNYPGVLGQAPIVSDSYIPPGWSEWYQMTSSLGPKAWINGSTWKYPQATEFNHTDIIKNISLDFIERNACEGNPFFLYLTPTAPHSPLIPAERHKNLFPDLQIPRVPSFNEADISDKPSFIRNNPPLTSNQINQADAIYRERIRMLQAVDEMVNEIVKTIENKGIDNNTYIIYSSDNGYFIGHHGVLFPSGSFYGKLLTYEENIHVPLLIRGPEILPNSSSDLLVSNIDLAPTIASLANVTPPNFVDGQSLNILLDGTENPQWRSAILAQAWQRIGPNPAWTLFSAIRTIQYKYIESYYWFTGPLSPTEYELYDLINDPYEINNIYSTADPALIADLKTKLDYLKTCQGQSCNQDPPPTDTTPPVITPNLEATLGNNNWYISDVNLSWNVSDTESGITSTLGCNNTTLTIDTTGESFTCQATSGGGTSSQSVTIQRDTLAPEVAVTGVIEGASYSLGSIPDAGCNTTDSTSGVATAATITIIGGNPDGTGEFTATCSGAIDNAGNSGVDVSVNYIVSPLPDTTPPVTSVTQSPNPNAGGWNNSDVIVSFTGTDETGGSGIATCTATTTLATEGANQMISGICTDNAGNISNTVTATINLDKTSPIVVVTGFTDGDTFTLGNEPIVGCDTQDTLSGIANAATVNVSEGNGDGTGSFTATCSGAIDNADNRAPDVSASYTVTP